MTQFNRRSTPSEKYEGCGSADDYGVDLNRNYPYKFAMNNIGSSQEPCEEIYRGEKALSEPETQAFAAFIEKHKNSL